MIPYTLKAADGAVVATAACAIEYVEAERAWRVDGALYVDPDRVMSVRYVPQAVSRFQARAALLQAGHLAAIETIMADPATDPLARLAWQDAQEFRRDSPTVTAMAAALGLSAEQLDDLFRVADGIVA